MQFVWRRYELRPHIVEKADIGYPVKQL